MPRPAVAVVIPFGGSPTDARELRDHVALLRLRDGDAVVVADNTPDGLLAREVPDLAATVVPAHEHRSAYSARNAGAAAADGRPWLLFTDSDCRPDPGLLDAFFDPAPDARTGLLVGSMLPYVRRPTRVARYVVTRQANEQELHLRHHHLPFGATGNLVVRAAAFEAVGGFHEGIRSGGDADLCWRVQAAGWNLEPRLGAVIHHRQRETPKAVLRQYLRYGAGGRWLRIRHPDSAHDVHALRGTAFALAGAAKRLVRGEPTEAAHRLADVTVIASERVGRFMGNRTPPPAELAGNRPAGRRVVLLVDAFPELSETFVTAEAHALRRLGADVRIEATARARRPNPAAATGLDVRWHEDDGTAERVAALAWLIRTRGPAVLRDVVDRRAWQADEWPRPLRHLAPVARRIAARGDEHLHAHFAAGSALDALRLHRLLGVGYSVTAHGYDIFQSPRNLAAKFEAAAFATSGSDYTVDALAAAVPGAAPRLRKVVMGIEPERWRREGPAGDGTVLAVGRLVEKKGFGDLLRAAALLRDEPALQRVLIVGEGPLRGELEALHAELGLGDRVALLGARTPEEVRDLLEDAAVVAIPCVVAADGDRDSMPVIAKEALAMEVPVVATAVCGLPEVVAEPWGRLVAPHDPPALADALAEVLRLPAAERAAAGAAGRDHVTRAFSVQRETAFLLGLVEDAVAGRPPRPRPAAAPPVPVDA